MLTQILSFLSGEMVGKLAEIFQEYQEKKLTKEELKFKLETFEAQNEQDLRLAQIALNEKEASHGSMFVAGWRPFLGWVCGLGFAMNFLVAPVGTFIVSLAGGSFEFPQAELTTMMPVLLGMLGLGGMRTFEKLNYKARNNLEG